MERKVPRPRHGAGVERGDLILIPVRRNEEGRGEDVLVEAQAGHVHAVAGQPIPVFGRVGARRREEERPFAQEREAPGDVRSAAARHAPHGIHEEGNRQAGHLVRDQVLDEVSGKRHQVVEGDGPGDHDLTRISDQRFQEQAPKP